MRYNDMFTEKEIRARFINTLCEMRLVYCIWRELNEYDVTIFLTPNK